MWNRYFSSIWSSKCIIVTGTADNQEPKKTDPKLFVSIVTLSAQDNAKLSKQLKTGFKRKK